MHESFDCPNTRRLIDSLEDWCQNKDGFDMSIQRRHVLALRPKHIYSYSTDILFPLYYTFQSLMPIQLPLPAGA